MNLPKPGHEQYEKFKNVDCKYWFDYKYCHTTGARFQKISRSLKACREAKNQWLKKQGESHE
ncbi:MAG TPA: DUF3873 domain-containing protein [Pricia antarctica]|uniref:DUF3873 domain-containing protein n=1 Tax=Pricia antarctica TaxID=641691 RepID=A0A831QK39_9FLAO|nr:DUF3873 domain-containing protein [Pricia antarctica]